MKSKLEIIQSQRVSTKDISTYLNCSNSKAYFIRRLCEMKFDGKVPAEPNKVTTESFLKSLNTTLEKELKTLNEEK